MPNQSFKKSQLNLLQIVTEICVQNICKLMISIKKGNGIDHLANNDLFPQCESQQSVAEVDVQIKKLIPMDPLD